MTLSPASGLVILAAFGAVMLVVTVLASRAEVWATRSGFLYASRNVGGVMAGFSIATVMDLGSRTLRECAKIV